MKTLVLVAHPEFDNSPTQSFLKASTLNLEQVQYHVLDQSYPDYHIDVSAERQAIRGVDQLIFQFPLYWYSAPASLKAWLDQVLQTRLEEVLPDYTGKTLGLVVSTGVAEAQFVAGGQEQFTLSEILRPYQALAQKLNLTYRKPLIISQFNYFTEAQKMALLIEYQQYLTMTDASFTHRSAWLIERLAQQQKRSKSPELAAILATLTDNQERLADLNETIQMMKGAL